MIATLVLLLSATCVTAAEMTPAQMACCASMGHDCGAAAKEQGCCSSEAPHNDAGSVAKRVSIAVPDAAVVQLSSIYVVPELFARTYATAIDDIAPSPPGTSTYLLISTFRI